MFKKITKDMTGSDLIGILYENLKESDLLQADLFTFAKGQRRMEYNPYSDDELKRLYVICDKIKKNANLMQQAAKSIMEDAEI